MPPFGREAAERPCKRQSVGKKSSSGHAARSFAAEESEKEEDRCTGSVFHAEPEEPGTVPQRQQAHELFGAEPAESDEQLSCSGSEDENTVVEGGSRIFEMGWQALHKFDSARMGSKMQNQHLEKTKRPYNSRKREQMARGSQRSDAFRKNGMDKHRVQKLLSSKACECTLFYITCGAIREKGFGPALQESEVHAKTASSDSRNRYC